MLRVIDDTGEDYLYPSELFMSIELSEAARRTASCRLIDHAAN